MGGPRYRLVGRESVLAGAERVREISSAFEADGASRLALPLFPTRGGSPKAQRVTGQVAHLLTVLQKRLGISWWFAGFGPGPDRLESLSAVVEDLSWEPGRLEIEAAAEVASLLSSLADGADYRNRLRPASVFGLSGSERSRHLAAAAESRHLAGDFEEWCRYLRQGSALWCADSSLKVRFTLDRGGVVFRAHHPVIHKALVDRCRKDGIDLL